MRSNMFTSIIKELFPQDERNGLYRVPQLPAVKLGKILRRDRRITSPSDVLAMHIFSGTFSSGMLILTRDRCFYSEGAFDLENVKKFEYRGKDCTVLANQNNQLIPHNFTVKNEQVAKSLERIFNKIAHHDPKSDEMVKQTYEGYSNTELDWLNLRDEIMRTIDMLYDRYNDGKLTLLEYESKKEELLSRL